MQWKHVQINVTGDAQHDELGEKLTALEAEGWIVVHVQRAGSGGRFDIVVKREPAKQ